ncbi:hypothetical protein FACS189485_20350 [Spirochaetia bacterium]|nr:hypothetical protein FACS189485_20350 [Spirochaetia bacterium]
MVKRFRDGPAFELWILQDGRAVDYTLRAEPECVLCDAAEGKLRIYIHDDETLVFEGSGLDLYFKTLDSYSYGTSDAEGKFRIIIGGKRTYSLFKVLKGQGSMSGPLVSDGVFQWNGVPVNHKREVHIACEEGKLLAALNISMLEKTDLPDPFDPDKDIGNIKNEWADFLKKMPASAGGDKQKRDFERVTWYNLWSSYVRARDVYRYDSMLMAKKMMSSVWSWDHCFNALAMAGVGQQAALEQFMAPFSLQASNGALPDLWSPNAETFWAITKPPVHGWCFGKLMDKFEYPEETLKTVYTHLEKWTAWWLNFRDEDHDGVPAYPQGCDSGWDNSTVFDHGYYVTSPDLSAFLVLQMHTLARIADKLKMNTSPEWRKRADILLEKMIALMWKGDQFVAVLSHSHTYRPDPSSLLVHIPVVLGNLLDHDKMEKTAAILEKRFLTEYGLATEAPDSPRYESDGYWRGPIWAPPTYLIVDGLRRGGFEKLAETIARRYLKLSSHVAKGNYENFDALTGKGLRAPGYTWSASVYMLLSWEYPN